MYRGRAQETKRETTGESAMIDVFRESSVVAGGVRFHYATAGRGPLVLLLHGFPERWTSWRKQIPALARGGWRVVAPDLRGYGQSDKPEGGYDLPSLAQDVASLITALGEERATVVGHDWGGAITWEAASRFAHRVERFAVLNCPHAAVMNEVFRRSPAQLARSSYMLFFNIPWLPERLMARDRGRAIVRRFEGAGVQLSRESAEALREVVTTPANVSPMLAYYRRVVRTTLRGGLLPYPVIRQPGLLIWGERDAVLGEELIAPHTRYAHDLVIRRIPDCGHFVQQQRPDEVNEVLTGWLAQQRERASRQPG